jgi:hypothetical protein
MQEAVAQVSVSVSSRSTVTRYWLFSPALVAFRTEGLEESATISDSHSHPLTLRGWLTDYLAIKAAVFGSKGRGRDSAYG